MAFGLDLQGGQDSRWRMGQLGSNIPSLQLSVGLAMFLWHRNMTTEQWHKRFPSIFHVTFDDFLLSKARHMAKPRVMGEGYNSVSRERHST